MAERKVHDTPSPTTASITGDPGVVKQDEPLEKSTDATDAAAAHQDPESPEVAQDATVRSKLRLYTILVALCLELFIAALDQTIVATSAPSITADLQDASGYTWIASAYLLASAATGPIWVKCSDIWGRKHIILFSVLLFAVASVVAAAARNMAMLIAGRALQGTAGGGIIQLVGVTISDLFSIRHRALFLSSMGLVWVLAGTMGPIIGGALTEYVTWRWCFWINLPICGLAFFIIAFFLDVHNPRTKFSTGLKAIDWFGTVSILGVTLLLFLGLDFGGVVYPWGSPTVICLIVFGVLLIPVFLYTEKRLARYPLVYLDVFKGSNLAIVVVALTHSMTSFGAEYYLPLYFQSVKQATPFQSGLYLLPMIITSAIVDVLAGVFMHRLGRYRELIWSGSALLTMGAGLYTLFGTNTDLGKLIGFQIIFGLGMSLLFQTPTIALQNNVSQADTATAMSTLSFIRALGTSLSTVLGGVVFQNSMNNQASSLAAGGLSPSTVDVLSGYHAAANVEITSTLEDPQQRQLVREAFAWSVRNMFIMYTCIAAVGVVASVFVKQRHMSKEHKETKTGIENMSERKTG